ncbi:hypothetical protein EV175_007541, partial [Coemansia sp. RSA 1933]
MNGSVAPSHEKSSLDNTHYPDADELDKHEKLIDDKPVVNSIADNIAPVPIYKLFRFSTKIDIILSLA